MLHEMWKSCFYFIFDIIYLRYIAAALQNLKLFIMTPTVITELVPELVKAFQDVKLIALDIEGVDLGRLGKISLVQLAPSPEQCFLLDLLAKDDPLVQWTRTLLEDRSVTKIIHDCRMDSDALKHLLNIELTNVHDTSCWHMQIKNEEDASLNTVLSANGIKQNVIRDSRVYATNHAFWATRPLTARMIEWAAGDVTSMFSLYEKQKAAIPNLTLELEAKHLSTARCSLTPTAGTHIVVVKRVGAFIGHGGSTIRALQKKTNTLIYPRGERSCNTFLVYYFNEASLAEVVKRARE